ALYYLFHTSGNLGVERAKVESGDAMRLPFPFPEDAPAGKDAPEIVSQVAKLFREAVRRAEDKNVDRRSLVKSALKKMHELVFRHRVKKGSKPPPQDVQPYDIIDTLGRLQRLHRKSLGSVELIRGIKVFDGNSIYIIRPLSQRFWTRTTALNDADEIASTIL